MPVGSVWKGKVKLHSNSSVRDYFVNIALSALDPSHTDMFFPELAHATSRAQLDLHPIGNVSGNNCAQNLTMLGMCLYDGSDDGTISYETMFKDEGRPVTGHGDGYFSIYHQGETTIGEEEHIDYQIRMCNPKTGGQIDVRNSENIV